MNFDYSVKFAAIDKISRKVEAIKKKMASLDNKAKQTKRTLSTVFDKSRFMATVRLNTAVAMKRLRHLKERMQSIRQSGMRNISLGMVTIGAGVAFGIGTVGKPIIDAKKYESSWNGVQKVVQGSKEQINKLKYDLIDMSKVVPKSARDLAEIAEAGAKLGISADKLKGFTNVAAKMSIAMNMPVEQVGEDMGKLGALLKYNIKDFEEFGDRLNHIADNTAADGAKVLNIAKRVAGQFGSLNFGKGDIVGISAVADMLSISQEVSGSGLNRILGKLREVKKYRDILTKDKGKGFVNIMETVSRKSKPAQMKWIQKYIAKSGEAMQLTQKMINNVELLQDTIKVANSSKTIGSLQREFESVTKTAEAKEKLMRNAFSSVFIKAGLKLLPIYKKVLDTITRVVEKIDKFAEKNPKLAKKIMMVTGAISALLVALGSIGILIGIAKIAFAGLLPLFSMASLPIMAVVSALGYLAYKTMDAKTAMEFARSAWYGFVDGMNAIKEAVKPAYEWIVRMIKKIPALDKIFSSGDGAKEWGRNIGAAIAVVSTALATTKILSLFGATKLLKLGITGVPAVISALTTVKTSTAFMMSPITLIVGITGVAAVLAGLGSIAKASHTAIMDKRPIAPKSENIDKLEAKITRIKNRIQAMKEKWSTGKGILNMLFGQGSSIAQIQQQEKMLSRAIEHLKKAKESIRAEALSPTGVSSASRVLVEHNHKVPTQKVAVQTHIKVTTDQPTTHAKVTSTNTQGVNLPNRGNE